MSKIDQQASRRHWDENLDPQNLGAVGGQRDLEREWAFYESDEQLYARSCMPPLRGAQCLELGGGLGVHALWLASQGAKVMVVDFSHARLAALSSEARRYDFGANLFLVQSSAEALPFGADRFDLIYTKSVLIHTQLVPALEEARRALRPGGRGVFVEPLDRNPFAGLYRRFLAPSDWQTFTRYFDEACWREAERVFPGSRRRPFYFFGFLAFVWQFAWPSLPLFRASLAMMRWVDRPLFGLIPWLRRFAWFNVCVVEKPAGGQGE